MKMILAPREGSFIMNDALDEKEYMLRRIKQLYGARLSDEQLDAVEKKLDPILSSLKDVREVPLENGDEPMIVFKPYREDRI